MHHEEWGDARGNGTSESYLVGEHIGVKQRPLACGERSFPKGNNPLRSGVTGRGPS